MASRVAGKIKLQSVDELLGVPEIAGTQEIEIGRIHSFPNHPFKVLQLSKHETSDILDIVLLPFRHLPVLLHCFRSIFCLGQTADKIFICHIRAVKLFVHS